MFIITYRKLFYAISGIVVAASLLALAIWGLNLGIDFKGGSLAEISYTEERPEKETVEAALAPLGVSASVRPAGEQGYIIRMRDLSEEERQVVESVLPAGAFVDRFNSIGPVLGREAVGKSILSILLVIAAIILFIAFAFRKVSEPVSSWRYGVLAIVALVHDILIPAGVFSVLGHFRGVEVDTLFVTALLVILGFSVHDTIVVFDRVRENLRIAREEHLHKTFDVLVGESITQTMGRSINTSLTTLLALFALYVFGPAATQYFSLALIIGIFSGTYSSIFLASPLLVTVEKWQHKV